MTLDMDEGIIPDIDLYLECHDDFQYEVPHKPPESEHIVIGNDVNWRVSFPQTPKEILKEVKAIPCKSCEKIFKSETRLNGHMQREHGNTKPFFCQLCNFRTNTVKNLRSHSKIHSEKHKSTVKDKQMSKTPFGVIINIEGKVEKIKKANMFKCYPCSRDFSSSSTLHRHFRLFHSEMSRKTPMYVKRNPITSTTNKNLNTLLLKMDAVHAQSTESNPNLKINCQNANSKTVHLEIYAS